MQCQKEKNSKFYIKKMI